MLTFIVDPDPDCRDMLAVSLSRHGHHVMTFETFDDACRVVEQGTAADLAVVEVRVPGRLTLEDFAMRLRHTNSSATVVIYSTEERCRRELVALGADGFVLRPEDVWPTLAALIKLRGHRNGTMPIPVMQ